MSGGHVKKKTTATTTTKRNTVSHRDSATLQADPSSSISPTTPEETPLIGQTSSLAPSVVQRTRSGRIITLPTRVNL